jgi:histidine triad (HIT) family protein
MSADCLFCKILAGEIPADRVYTDDVCLAFRDINPQAPIHLLIIPHEHVGRMSDIADDHELMLGHLLLVAARLARELGVSDDGYRLVINCGAHGQQAVEHLHVHLLAGRQMTWPPG